MITQHNRRQDNLCACTKEDRITQVTLVWSHPMFLQYLNLGTELAFEVEGDKYNFFERGKYNFLWTYFLKS